MKNTFGKIILSLTLFIGVPAFAQMQCDSWGNCTGTYSFPSAGGNMGALTPPPSSGVTQGGGISAEAAAAKQKAEAYGRCMSDLFAAKQGCFTASNNNLLSNQAVCTKVGTSMAVVTAGTGILLSLTGVGSVVGVLITAAAGTSGTMIYNQCNNTAQNIYNNTKEACELTFNQNKLKCEAMKP